MKRQWVGLGLVFLSACSGRNVVSAGFAISNSVTWLPGSGETTTTTLAGDCSISGSTGHIECDGLVLRVATPGVFNGIGWEERAPSQPTCAGSPNAAPKVGVF